MPKSTGQGTQSDTTQFLERIASGIFIHSPMLSQTERPIKISKASWRLRQLKPCCRNDLIKSREKEVAPSIGILDSAECSDQKRKRLEKNPAPEKTNNRVKCAKEIGGGLIYVVVPQLARLFIGSAEAGGQPTH